MEALKSKVQKVVNGHHKTTSGNGKTMLITGGSGFVAAHVLNAFLSRGYNVRTTVRSEQTAEKVKKSHTKYLSQLSFAIVPDVATPGGHDEAVKGVDGVCSGNLFSLYHKLILACPGNSYSFTVRHERRRQ
jgi:NADPH:quinone reductase-like Zn-dependent oxidoreductase